jgi:hypothetical protein
VDVETLIDIYAEEMSYYGKTNTDRVDVIKEDQGYRVSRDVAIFDVLPSSIKINESISTVVYQAISVVRTKSSGKLKSYLLNMSIEVKNNEISSINGKVDHSLELYDFKFK